MVDVFQLFTRYFWLIALVVNAANAVAYQRAFREYATKYPEREQGYRQFLIGFVAINTLVWLIMGIGIIVGGLPSVFAYFNPSSGNPYVLAWHAAIISFMVAGVIWIFFGTGAQFIIDHPGLLNVTLTEPNQVRFWFGVSVLGGVFGEIFMWTMGANIATLP